MALAAVTVAELESDHAVGEVKHVERVPAEGAPGDRAWL
jgi:hypothetical protein